MKTFLSSSKMGLLGALLLSSLSIANTSPTPPEIHVENLKQLSAYRFGACDWWNSIQTNSGMNYACGIYPRNITVPDAYDVSRALDDAERRIAALEAKVGTLERQLAKSE